VATMQDVAARANVSIATVSFVVNKSKRVSPETEARVREAMRELGFRRNAVARALASRRTRIIALLLPELNHRVGGTMMQFVSGAANTAKQRGYNLVLWPLSGEADEMSELLGGGLVDGVLLMEVRMHDDRVLRLAESDVPFAMIGRTEDPSGLLYVDMDSETTMRMSLDYLWGLGHRKVALIVEQLDVVMEGYGPTVRTEAAYRSLVKEHGCEPVVVTCEKTASGGRGAASELLERAPDTTAVIVMNEEAVFGVVSGLGRAGLTVPADISIMSIETSPEMGAFSEPVLTTMNAPGEQLGRMGADALIDRLEGTDKIMPQLLLACTLQEGESTAPPRELRSESR
jgi:DNA-binding LacI/PurR family transcriptional regulator